MTPHGAALLAYLHGERGATLMIRRDDGLEAPLPMTFSFREPAEFTEIERAALERCRGHVLDVGAGSGLHSLALQARGVTVTAIDLDPGAVEVMRARGVADARCADVWRLGGPAPRDDERFDTVLLLGHNIGLVEDLVGLVRFLAHARGLIRDDGCILLNSYDVLVTEDPRHLSYHELNRRAGRYVGETRMALEFGGVAGPVCGWLHVDAATLARLAGEAGWRCEVVRQEATGDYLAWLTRADAGA